MRIDGEPRKIPARGVGGLAPGCTARGGQQNKRAAKEVKAGQLAPCLREPQMRCTGARTATCLMWIGMDRTICPFGHNCWRVIDVTKLDIEIVRERLEIGCAEVRRRARNVARIGLFDRKLRDRPTFQIIAIEQRWPRNV